MISVIIPTLNEENQIGSVVEHAFRAGAAEIIVSDGGSRDSTVEIARGLGCRVIGAPRGRSFQMNAGAGEAKGEILLFLHADTLLPPEAGDCVRQALRDPGVVGGRFDIRMDRRGIRYSLLSRLINGRSRLTRISTGDQAIFVRREVFTRLGGYAEISLMEDVELSRRLKRIGRVACLRSAVVTSARRWERGGWLNTVLLMWWLRFLYAIGVAPDRLRRYYR